MKKKILISCYAVCGPGHPSLRHPGSEFATSWNFIRFLSDTKRYEITVIFGSTDIDFCSHKNVDSLRDLPSVRFYHVLPSKMTRLIAHFLKPVRLMWPVLLRAWNKDAYKSAVKLHAVEEFDIVHQFGPAGFKNPGYLYRLGVPSVWGPVIGWHYYDVRLAYAQGFWWAVYAAIWNAGNFLYSHQRLIRSAARGYSRVIFGTPEVARRFNKRFNVLGEIIPEQGIDDSEDQCSPTATDKEKVSRTQFNSSKLKVLWVGTLEFRKNLKLFLDIVSRLDPERFEITIVGDGPLRVHYESKLAQLTESGLVSYIRNLPRKTLMEKMNTINVLVITTLAEGNTSILFEALQGDVVAVAPCINGFENTLSDGGGILVDYDQSFSQIIESYVSALVALSNSGTFSSALSLANAKKDAFRYPRLIDAYVSGYEKLLNAEEVP